MKGEGATLLVFLNHDSPDAKIGRIVIAVHPVIPKIPVQQLKAAGYAPQASPLHYQGGHGEAGGVKTTIRLTKS